MTLLAIVACVGISWAATTVTWTSSDLEDIDLEDPGSKTINGVTLTVNAGVFSGPKGGAFAGDDAENSFTFTLAISRRLRLRATYILPVGTMVFGPVMPLL